MARGARKAIAVGVAVAAACCLQRHLTFVPGPRHAAPVAAAAASMMMAPAAFADEIGDAAKKLGDASYSFAKEVDWNNGIFLQAPGKFQPLEALKAIDKMIEMGAAADPKLLKEAAEAHHKAIGSISGPNGVTSRADWDAVNAALGRVIASVPKAKVMAVYDSVKAITDPGVPAYMKSLVNGPDAEKAYQGFLEFKDVVEKNQVATASAPAVVPSGDKIGEAAKALSDASYPFIKDIDWLSDVYLKPLPGKTAPETLQAIDKMIVMGAKMDGNLLKAAAEAHHKAIGSIDATGVTSAADYEAVNAAIGRLVASVPKSTVMDVYNSMAKVVDSSVPNNMFSKVNPLDAVAAAKGFYTFKDVVEASQTAIARRSSAVSHEVVHEIVLEHSDIQEAYRVCNLFCALTTPEGIIGNVDAPVMSRQTFCHLACAAQGFASVDGSHPRLCRAARHFDSLAEEVLVKGSATTTSGIVLLDCRSPGVENTPMARLFSKIVQDIVPDFDRGLDFDVVAQRGRAEFQARDRVFFRLLPQAGKYAASRLAHINQQASHIKQWLEKREAKPKDIKEQELKELKEAKERAKELHLQDRSRLLPVVRNQECLRNQECRNRRVEEAEGNDDKD
ncbi:unnamed protein product [Cladocopium goreaui]|uniref:Peridinin-chlorophyll a-binding protein, chloroplastic (PCP) n=1 Tax=Cladocopium goreaui TaxID=2562237 RepID=A0A9P1BQQ9_9DINO|nr:unnamed protein product [Cladocopium goreaui]